jgi:hypothetical protein
VWYATGRVLGPAWAVVLVWSPRRNRTGDPFLTMDLAVTAVRTGVLAGRIAP